MTDACVVCHGVEAHNPNCTNRPLTSAEIGRIFGQRKRKATLHTQRGREVVDAPLVSAAHHLDVVLTDPELREPAVLLLEELATLADLCSAIKAAQTDKEGGKTASSPVPSFQPAHVSRKRTQVARRINEEAEWLAAWNQHPHDPYSKKGDCADCGGRLPTEAKHCLDCGAPTLRAFRRDS